MEGSDGMGEGRWPSHRKGRVREASFAEEVTQLSLESVCRGVGVWAGVVRGGSSRKLDGIGTCKPLTGG